MVRYTVVGCVYCSVRVMSSGNERDVGISILDFIKRINFKITDGVLVLL